MNEFVTQQVIIFTKRTEFATADGFVPFVIGSRPVMYCHILHRKSPILSNHMLPTAARGLRCFLTDAGYSLYFTTDRDMPSKMPPYLGDSDSNLMHGFLYIPLTAGRSV